jgi:hypothetical protein
METMSMNIMRTTRSYVLTSFFAAFPFDATLSADYTIKAGSTDVSVYFIVEEAGGTPSSVAYTRNGDATQTLTPGTALSSANAAHSDNNWFVVQQDIGSLSKSVVRYDLPDAVCAAGKSSVTLTFVGESAFATLRIDLIGYDQTATNLPANVTQIGGDATAADNAEAFFDGSGYAGHVISGELDAVTSQTEITIDLPVSGTMAADSLKDCRVLLREGNQKGIRRIVASSATFGGADLVDLTLDSAPPWTLTDNAAYTVLPPDFRTEDRASLLAVKTKTDFLPSHTAGTEDGLFIAGTNAQTTVTSGFGAGTIVAASFGAGAIDANAIAAGAITTSQAPNLDAAITTRASAANLTLAMGTTFDTATDSL